MAENVVQVKSFAFAARIVRLCQFLANEKREYVLSKQLLRCGSSVGANVEEAIGGQSRPDFLSKLSIAYKEAREALYWLRLLKETDYLTEPQFDSIYADGEELCRIITAIKKTTAANS
ncbi:MAG: four helix bundle protein [Armatimonadetes bacterium]|nr:four helix bundle protein [Armatimonadota bacterium]